MRPSSDGQFPTTHWTLVARLKSHDAHVARPALEELCQQYHYPLYCYIRRRGLEHHDAEDALHDFLAKLLRLNAFDDLVSEKGRLRSFLATALRRFIINWQQGQKSKELEINLDLVLSEQRYRKERLSDHDTPERLFDRKWGQTLLHRTLKKLGSSYEQKGKTDLFIALKPVLLTGGSLRGHDGPSLATSLGISDGALRVALNRLLKDYRDILTAEVSQTVDDQSDVEQEIQCLLEACS